MDPTRQEEIISRILLKNFPSEPDKQIIYAAGNRLNFSCPYCGDSLNSRKKRGNFYLDTGSYKCYNGGCGTFKDGETFFKDFAVFSFLTSGEKVSLRKIIKENREKRRSHYGNVDISYFFEMDISPYLVERDYIMSKRKLIEVKNSPILEYLEKRNQTPDKRFAWDNKNQNLYLFNLTSDEKNILGLQIRNMRPDNFRAKYYTYNLSGIWEKLLWNKDHKFLEECKKINPISHVFNVGKINFSSMITIFEGPMDSWLWYNSVALCSVENKFPFDLENIRFWDDWDPAGRTKSVERLSNGFTVFNWSHFLEENDLPFNRKWDLNDLVNYLRRSGKKIQRFEKYFTNDQLDLRYFIDA